jgi:uncharacterized protein (DUF58 family)
MLPALFIVLGVLLVAVVIIMVTLLAVEGRSLAPSANAAPSTGRGDISALLKRIRVLEIKVRHMVHESFAGSYHSVFKGQGMNFEEVREYQPGDEIRSIDWNVTARLGQPHVKLFTEERELTMVLLVDLSASGNYGSQEFSKREIAAEIAATLAFSAIRNSDRVSLIIFTDDVELFIPPGKGRTHVLRVIREVLYHDPKSRKTNVGTALSYMNRVIHSRSIAFLISDFHAADFSKELSISSRRHDLTAIQIHDPLEESLPRIGRVMLEDQESGEMMEVNTSSRQVRGEFEKRVTKRQEELTDQFVRGGIDHISIATDEDYLPALRQFFARRERRLVR